MINLRTPAQRYREHAMQERQRAIISLRMGAMLKRELQRFANPGNLDKEQNFRRHRSVLTRILMITYTQTFNIFGKKILQAFARKKDDEDAGPDILGDARDRYIQRHVGSKVKEISDTSREKLQTIIDEGESQDLSSGEIADLIEERLGGEFAGRRAETIARTEVHGASQDSQFEIAQSTGLNLVKRWVAVEDKRTREDHVDADGQVVDMDDTFTVGEDDLLYPGDPTGSPEQVINCRCIVVFEEAPNGN